MSLNLAKKREKPLSKGIYKRGNIFWFRRQIDGKKIVQSLDTEIEEIAVRRIAQILSSGTLEQKASFDTEIEEFLAHKKAMGSHTERSTGWYKENLAEFGRFIANKPCAMIKLPEIENFYKMLRARVSENTAKSRMGAVRSFFSWAVKTKKRYDNPTKEVKNPRISQPAKTDFATKEQRNLIVSSAEGNFDLQFALYCAFHAGMRLNEISECHCEWFKISAENKHVHIQKTNTFTPKNKHNRHIPLSDDFVTFLIENDIPNKKGFVIRGEKLNRIGRYRVSFRESWAKHMKKNGVDFSPHDGRHTFASLLAQKGVDMYRIAKWLGDTLEVTIKHYAHLAPNDDSVNI